MDGLTQPPSIDRLSALPDELLCRVLSLLPTTKQSVSTSVLAQRWRLLWAHVPNLDFANEKQDIINRVMMRHKLRHLNAFRISKGKNCNTYNLESWITTLIDRNVQKLTIHMMHDPWIWPRSDETEYDLHERECVCKDTAEYLLLRLPRRLFTCKTLVELSLANCQLNVPMTGTIYFLPALKNLHLENVEYESDKSLPRLLSCCPVLEELTIVRAIDDGDDRMGCCCISSPTIIRLNIKHIDSYANHYVPDYTLHTPALSFLEHDSTHYCLISKFLENADNLQVLTISCKNNRFECWMELDQVPACLVSNLQIVRIVHFGCTMEQEFNMVRYFLRNAKLLKKMEISSKQKGRLEAEKKVEAHKRISLFERASVECELVFL